MKTVELLPGSVGSNPTLSVFPSGIKTVKKVKKIVQNQQKIRRWALGDSPRQTGDSGMVFAHKGLVKGFCEEAKRRQKFAKTLFCAYLAPRNININS